MNRLKAILKIRDILSNGKHTIGSWIQIPNSSIAEIMGQAGYDWVAIDMEHGSISLSQLPDLFRALELGETLPLVRLAQSHPKDCKQALDAGAGGVIIPMVETATQLEEIRDACRWPPKGNRGVGFSRANLFGKNFDSYMVEAQQPILIPMIESLKAVKNLNSILEVEGVDAILIGPYDLSASLGLTGEFERKEFLSIIDQIKSSADKASIPCGIHIVEPSIDLLEERLSDGYRFIAYSIDSVLLINSAKNPIFN